jgi:hypothetical protein
MSGQVLIPRHYKHVRALVRVSLILLVVWACGCRDESCDDYSYEILFESGVESRDTTDVRDIFQDYVAFVTATTDTFPDGNTGWNYMRSVLDQREICGEFEGLTIWRVTYRFDPPTCDCRYEVYVDSRGRIFELQFWPP